MSQEDQYNSRYDRQERLVLWDQKLIQNSSVLVVGIGGTGSEVIKNLSLLGIGKLILVDVDTIEYSNLNRQMLFRETDIGKNKAEVAKDRINTMFNPQVNVETFSIKIQDIPTEIFEKVDVIAGCVDNFLARQYINSLAIELLKPYIDSATDGYLGQVQYIQKNFSSCLACDNPPPPDETNIWTAPCTLIGTPRIREHCAWKALYSFYTKYNREPRENSNKDMKSLLKIVNNCTKNYRFPSYDIKELRQLILAHIPSIVTVNSVISGIQSQLIINTLLFKKRSSLKRKDQQILKKLRESERFQIPSLTIYSGLTSTFSTFKLLADPDCIVCGNKGIDSNQIPIIQVYPDNKFKEIIQEVNNKYKDEFLAFRGNKYLDEGDLIKDILSNGDRITFSPLSGENDMRVKIIFKKKNI